MADHNITKEVEETQVNLLVGGKAKRMDMEIKCLLKINGITLIERIIQQYSDCGFKKFNILAGFGSDEVQDHLSKSNHAKKIDLAFSLDDNTWKAGGKGKALKQALKNNVINRKKRSIVAFPDDIFTDGTLPLELLAAHLDKKSLVTVLTTTGTDYAFGEIILDEQGKVNGFVEKPFVSKITSTGVYVMEPAVYHTIDDLVSLDSTTPQEFEKVVLEKMAKEGKVANHTIPHHTWIPVNTKKEFETAKLRLEKN
ncbi:MAG TPA: sugar phosphate nucleotidyltransferase [Nitrosopumilaceae archaeon]|nr:sugar phosphate nucleotidyltransferase [Nitrosopumilaceae archaeon]